MCKCVNIEFGSYENQIWVHPPAHMPKENGYCLDRCIAEEVMQLWMKGITTEGCCCGHNKVPDFSYIQVAEKDIEKMRELGYEHRDNPMYLERQDLFIPKTKT